jgi:putative ABC transport system substrate-binding protein
VPAEVEPLTGRWNIDRLILSHGPEYSMRRRTFISLLSGAATWPLAAGAQQLAMTAIGYLGAASPATGAQFMAALRQSLADAGFIEGYNVAIQSNWAEGQYDRLPAMAAEMVHRQVAVIIATGGTAPALAAKAATTTIPLVFAVTDDPVALGLVVSLARPGGNATGVTFLLAELGAKQLGLLRELVPAATRIGLLVNPNNTTSKAQTSDVLAAASAIDAAIDVVRARNSREIEAAFAALVRNGADALIVGTDPFLYSRRVQLASLAARHAIPAIYPVRENAEVGGLMSYGTSLTEVYRQVGAYTVRILKGAKPADLPVVRSTKLELVINLPTARVLGLDVPPMLLARADDVIE